MSRRAMVGRLLLRALWVRPARTLTALTAITVGAGVASATLSIYSNVQAKLHREFRGYGANLVLAAASGQALPASALPQIEARLPAGGAAAPFAFAVATGDARAPVVVVGTDFARTRSLNSWWKTSAWPAAAGQALVGARTAFAASAQSFTLDYAGRPLTLAAAGILRTGGQEDSRVYLPLAQFTAWTGLEPAVIEVYFPGPPAQVEAFARTLASLFPGAQAQPVREIAQTEGAVLEKTRSTLLACVLVIALLAVLSVLATLTASVLDRRRDFALMKALGATLRLTYLLFAAEAAILGAVGGIIGYGAGTAAAGLISWRSFHFHLTAPLLLLPEVLAGSVVVTLFAAILPLRMLRRLQPAAILKGD